jgi:hypothetical protein
MSRKRDHKGATHVQDKAGSPLESCRWPPFCLLSSVFCLLFLSFSLVVVHTKVREALVRNKAVDVVGDRLDEVEAKVEDFEFSEAHDHTHGHGGEGVARETHDGEVAELCGERKAWVRVGVGVVVSEEGGKGERSKAYIILE